MPKIPAKKIAGAAPPANGNAETEAVRAGVSAFPNDPKPIGVVEERRGPGRPPALCPVCNLRMAECKGHEAIPPAPAFTEKTIQGFLKTLANMTALSVHLATGAPAEKLAAVWGFTESELALVSEDAALVANKYAPEWFRQYEPEVSLAMCLGPIIVAKVTATRAIVASFKKLQEKPTANTPSPALEGNKPLVEQAKAA